MRIQYEDTFYSIFLNSGLSVFIRARVYGRRNVMETAKAVATMQKKMAVGDPEEPELPRENTTGFAFAQIAL